MSLAHILSYASRVGTFSISTLSAGSSNLCDLVSQICEIRAQFRSNGRKPADVVLFHGQQGPAAFVTFWACVLEGLVFAPVDTTWPDFRLRQLCERIKPDQIVAEPLSDQRWEGLLPGCPVEVVGPGRQRQGHPRIAEPVSVPPTAPAAYLCTSGSTGMPKIVVLSHGALAGSAQRVVDAFGWRSDETLLNLPEPHTISGLRNALIAAPLLGVRSVALPPRDRQTVLDIVDVVHEKAVTRLVAAPLVLRQINLMGRRISPTQLASLRAVYCTGADLHMAETQVFHAATGVPVINYYGLTESAGICLSQVVENWDPLDGSLGWPVGVEARLVDEAGDVLGNGGAGELQVRMLEAAPNYLDDPVATASLYAGEWLRTGDIMRRDSQGRHFLLGRTGLFINSVTTERISPQQIEAVLERHPIVCEAAVAGVADLHGGERIVAILVTGGEELSLDTKRELAALVSSRLGPTHVPTRFELTTALPRAATGKLLRRELVQLVSND